MSSRPISPHIGIYRWYLTMALSIGHRASGLALFVFILFLTWWLLALATGPGPFAFVHGLAGSIVGRLALFVWTFIAFFHGANGARHLVWDTGYGYRIDVARRSGQAVLVAAAALTLLTWIVVALA